MLCVYNTYTHMQNMAFEKKNILPSLQVNIKALMV